MIGRNIGMLTSRTCFVGVAVMFIASWACMPSSARGTRSASYLFDRCSVNGGIGDSECFSRILAIKLALPALRPWCSSSVDIYEVRRIVLEFLRANPKQLDEPMVGVVLTALDGSYPCARITRPGTPQQ